MAKASHTQLQEEANEEMPVGISGLQSAKDVRIQLVQLVDRVDVHLSQEAEADKASVLEQYTDLAARKAVIDEQQATLLRELKGIKEQIQNFEQHRSGIMVSTRQCFPHDLVLNQLPCRAKSKMPWGIDWRRRGINNTIRRNSRPRGKRSPTLTLL